TSSVGPSTWSVDGVVRGSASRLCSSTLFEAAGRVLVQQARDQRVMGQALRERALLDCLQILARQADVQPPVFLERRLCVAREASSFALTAAGGLPFAPFDGLEQLLLVGVNLHGRTP